MKTIREITKNNQTIQIVDMESNNWRKFSANVIDENGERIGSAYGETENEALESLYKNFDFSDSSTLNEILGMAQDDGISAEVAHEAAQMPAAVVVEIEHYIPETGKTEIEKVAVETPTPAEQKPAIVVGTKVDVESYEVYKTLWGGAVHNPGYTFPAQPIFNAIVTGLFEESEVEILKNGDYCYVPEIACKPTGHRLTTQEAADVLNISRRAVLKACEIGTLKADKIGRDWLIATSALTDYRKTYLRKPGRK